MNYITSIIAEQIFKKDPRNNQWLYYFNGRFSKGRIVDDTETKNKLLKFNKRIYISSIFLGLLFGFAGKIDIYTIVLFFVFIIFVMLRHHFLTRGLPNSDVDYKKALNLLTSDNVWYK